MKSHNVGKVFCLIFHQGTWELPWVGRNKSSVTGDGDLSQIGHMIMSVLPHGSLV